MHSRACTLMSRRIDASRAQEPDKGQDEQQCKTVNECINSFTAGMSHTPPVTRQPMTSYACASWLMPVTDVYVADLEADDDGEDEAEEDMEDAEPAAGLQALAATAGAEAAEQPTPALPTQPSPAGSQPGQGIQASDLARVLGCAVLPRKTESPTGTAPGQLHSCRASRPSRGSWQVPL